LSNEAFILDLDGTIVDNMGIHGEAFAHFCDRHGLPRLTLEMRARLDGKRNRDIFPILFDRDLPAEELARYIHEKEGLYRELSRGKLEPLPGLLRLLDLLDARRIPVAVATSSPIENIRHTLAELRLERRLTVIARGDLVPRGKPHPDVFLEAARLVGADPLRCLAFEDAPAGIAAAQAAGMTCFAVTTNFTAEQLAHHPPSPDAVFRDFEEFLASTWAAFLET
jgi:beta-phosphoglucomutase